MIQLKDYIKIYPNILKSEICKKIITQPGLSFDSAPVLDASSSTEQYNTERKCYIKTLDKQFNQFLYDAIGTILLSYQAEFKYFYTGLSCEDTGYEHLLYKGEEQGEYKTHTDHFDLYPRVLSCSFILNENYDGGDFSFFEGEYIVKKEAGSAVIFPSNFCFPHAVTPVSNGDRHAIITWIH
jgi:hypothetical protein